VISESKMWPSIPKNLDFVGGQGAAKRAIAMEQASALALLAERRE
jgi:hypothetical protein